MLVVRDGIQMKRGGKKNEGNRYVPLWDRGRIELTKYVANFLGSARVTMIVRYASDGAREQTEAREKGYERKKKRGDPMLLPYREKTLVYYKVRRWEPGAGHERQVLVGDPPYETGRYQGPAGVSRR